MIFPTSTKSSTCRPRVASAGEPIRRPDETAGGVAGGHQGQVVEMGAAGEGVVEDDLVTGPEVEVVSTGLASPVAAASCA